MIDVDEAEKATIELAGNLAVHECRVWRCDEDYKPLIAAIRALRSAAFEAGANSVRVLLAELVDHEDSRHDDCELCDRVQVAIRSLAAKESSDGK